MKKIIQFLMMAALFLLIPCTIASTSKAVSPENKVPIQVDLYLTTTCPHCQKADLFFQEIEKEGNLSIRVSRFYINQDKSALKEFYKTLKAQGLNDFSVPSIFFCKSRWAGFDSPATTGKKLLSALFYCQQQLEQNGQLSSRAVQTLQQWATTNQMEESIQPFQTQRSFIPMFALSQAMSPCSLFLILVFLAFISIPDSTGARIRMGLLFLLGLVLMNAIELSMPQLVHQLQINLRFLSVAVGLALLFILVQIQLRRVWSSQSVIVGLVAIFSAFILQVYQQTCISNYAVVFAHWLSTQHFSNLWKWINILRYQLVYLIPFIVLGSLLIRFVHHRYIRLKSIIHDASILILGVSALFFIVHPEMLSNAHYAWVTLFFALFSAFVRNRLLKSDN